jgi:hypothetical protein
MTFDNVAAIALPLPGVALGTSYGTPALKVAGKLLARLREDGDLVLKVEDGVREALLELQPDVFHTTPHYDGYPVLLIRLAAADPEQIAGLVERAWGGLASAKLRRARV